VTERTPSEASEASFRARLAALGAATLGGLEALEAAWRRLDPATLPELRAGLARVDAQLGPALAAFEAAAAPAGLEGLRADLLRGAGHVRDALGLVLGDGEGTTAPPVARILEAMRIHARAQESLYPLRRVLPPLGRAFVEPAFHARMDALDPEPPPGASVGLHRAAGAAGEGDRARGGFSLYVPEAWDGARALPLVVALHGGFGHGADFLWTWLREARGRGFLLLAPTSRGSTWSLDAPERDGAALRSMVELVASRWRVDRERVLLTGLSDGGTFALLTGLHPVSPFTALAPVAGVLHPLNFALGNLARARGRPIYQVHGARDWLFPVGLARLARDALAQAGAALVYRELDDLAHAYPREENDRILTWLDPRLALPGAQAP
jgi:phospholipase/carboxylesterase